MTQTATPTIRSRRQAEAARRKPVAPPRTIADVQELLARTIADLANGEIGPKQATAIAYSCRVLGRLLIGGKVPRLTDMLERLKRLEAEAKAAGLTPPAPRQPGGDSPPSDRP